MYLPRPCTGETIEERMRICIPSPPNSVSYSEIRKGEEEEGLSSEDMKSSIISSGLQMLSKSFRNFSQLFVFKEMEMEMEMEIGLPTDVKHLQHIGLDDGCDNLINPEMLVADFDKPQVSGSSYLRNHEEQEFKIYEAATLDVVDKLASGNFVESLVTKTGDFFIVAKAQPTN
ncbi:hypothetical protein RJ640_016715 [Escallonia rubra]|uniref:CRIB domain-containing protein n=1 Tax=Escallonia rubra TaxID=112253 RepID=A0AA88QY65_9ASTE|nr:hypothetical protein RJ640_016715 [Escallonia rubra]